MRVLKQQELKQQLDGRHLINVPNQTKKRPKFEKTEKRAKRSIVFQRSKNSGKKPQKKKKDKNAAWSLAAPRDNNNNNNTRRCRTPPNHSSAPPRERARKCGRF
tara:strand:+ start:144 stop:455 length:312 start_codon:yes stop_codon:yes gene_type:complete